METFTTVSTALGIVERVSKGFVWLRERVKASKDADLREKINALYDDFLDLKAKLSDLRDENAQLQQRLAAQHEKPEIRQVGETNYYFVGDQGPYCQACYGDKRKLAYLTPAEQTSGGTCRRCQVCQQVFYEETKPQQPVRMGRRRPWVTNY